MDKIESTSGLKRIEILKSCDWTRSSRCRVTALRTVAGRWHISQAVQERLSIIISKSCPSEWLTPIQTPTISWLLSFSAREMCACRVSLELANRSLRWSEDSEHHCYSFAPQGLLKSWLKTASQLSLNCTKPLGMQPCFDFNHIWTRCRAHSFRRQLVSQTPRYILAPELQITQLHRLHRQMTRISLAAPIPLKIWSKQVQAIFVIKTKCSPRPSHFQLRFYWCNRMCHYQFHCPLRYAVTFDLCLSFHLSIACSLGCDSLWFLPNGKGPQHHRKGINFGSCSAVTIFSITPHD